MTSEDNSVFLVSYSLERIAIYVFEVMEYFSRWDSEGKSLVFQGVNLALQGHQHTLLLRISCLACLKHALVICIHYIFSKYCRIHSVALALQICS